MAATKAALEAQRQAVAKQFVKDVETPARAAPGKRAEASGPVVSRPGAPPPPLRGLSFPLLPPRLVQVRLVLPLREGFEVEE